MTLRRRARRPSLSLRINSGRRNARLNMLSVPVSQGVSGWLPGDDAANTTLVQNFALASAPDGTCLKLTAIGAGAIGCTSPRMPVSALAAYLGRAEFRAATIGRQVRVYLEWFNGTYINGEYATSATSTTSGWTLTTSAATMPANATLASVQVVIPGCAAGEVHYVDKIAMNPGANSGWD